MSEAGFNSAPKPKRPSKFRSLFTKHIPGSKPPESNELRLEEELPSKLTITRRRLMGAFGLLGTAAGLAVLGLYLNRPKAPEAVDHTEQGRRYNAASYLIDNLKYIDQDFMNILVKDAPLTPERTDEIAQILKERDQNIPKDKRAEEDYYLKFSSSPLGATKPDIYGDMNIKTPTSENDTRPWIGIDYQGIFDLNQLQLQSPTSTAEGLDELVSKAFNLEGRLIREYYPNPREGLPIVNVRTADGNTRLTIWNTGEWHLHLSKLPDLRPKPIASPKPAGSPSPKLP